jgi:hypothetical protein
LPEPLGPSTTTTLALAHHEAQPLERGGVALGGGEDAEDVPKLDRGAHAPATGVQGCGLKPPPQRRERFRIFPDGERAALRSLSPLCKGAGQAFCDVHTEWGVLHADRIGEELTPREAGMAPHAGSLQLAYDTSKSPVSTWKGGGTERV